MVYTVPDYEPISNKVVEELLEALYLKDNKKLTDFTAAELMLGNKELVGPSYDGTLYLETECLKFVLEKNGEDRRKTSDINSKHPIDVDRVLLKYDIGNNIDYITIIAGGFHDLAEEDKSTIPQIRSFLEDTINSMETYHRTKYLQGIDEIANILHSLTDPFYKQLQRVSNAASRINVSSYKKDEDIREIVDLIKTEKKDLDLSIKLNSVYNRIKKKSNLTYFHEHTGVKNVIDIIEDTKKDYMKHLINIYFPKNVKKEIADKIRKIKTGDKIARNYETVEEEPSREYPRYNSFKKKHNLIKLVGQDELDTRKRKISNGDILIKKNETGIPRLLKEDLTLGEYNNLEDFKMSGSEVLKELYKTFPNVDFFCKYMNFAEYDPTSINLKNAEIISTLNKVIKPRKNHLIEWYHVQKKIAKKILKDINNYKFTYKLTNSNSPNDIILRYYAPAMEGHYEMLGALDKDKKKQLRHLLLYERIFMKYAEDIFANDFGELRYRNLFTFDWGNFLDKYFDSGNGKKIEAYFKKNVEENTVNNKQIKDFKKPIVS